MKHHQPLRKLDLMKKELATKARSHEEGRGKWSDASCLRGFVVQLSRSRVARLGSLALVVSLLQACSSAVSSGHNAALSADDLQSMTSQMAAGIIASPAVQAEIAKNGPLKIVCEPVVNEMTGEILPAGQAQAYTAQVRALLSEKAPNQFEWIMNRDDFYALRGQELSVPLGPSPDAVNPQYALQAKFQSITQEDSAHRSAFYLCVYRLTDIDHRTILWTGSYKVKKRAVKGFLD